MLISNSKIWWALPTKLIRNLDSNWYLVSYPTFDLKVMPVASVPSANCVNCGRRARARGKKEQNNLEPGGWGGGGKETPEVPACKKKNGLKSPSWTLHFGVNYKGVGLLVSYQRPILFTALQLTEHLEPISGKNCALAWRTGGRIYGAFAPACTLLCPM